MNFCFAFISVKNRFTTHFYITVPFYQSSYWENYHNLSIFAYILLPFRLITFSIPNYFWIVLFNSFSYKAPIISFKISYEICIQNSIFNFFNNKNLFKTIWTVIFFKNNSRFWYSYIITNIKFRVFIIAFFIKVNMFLILYQQASF